MRSLFTGPYAARIARARAGAAVAAAVPPLPHCTRADADHANSSAAAATLMADCAVAATAAAHAAATPPPLRVLQRMRRRLRLGHGRHRTHPTVPSALATPLAPFSSCDAATAAAAAAVSRHGVQRSLALMAAPTSTQLARLPVRVLTQLVVWRRARRDCVSAHEATPLRAGTHTRIWGVGARRTRGGAVAAMAASTRLRCGVRWVAALQACEAAASPRRLAMPLARITSTRETTFYRAPAVSTPSGTSAPAPPAAAAAASVGAAAAEAAPVDAPIAAAPLHTPKRSYSSAADTDAPTEARRTTTAATDAEKAAELPNDARSTEGTAEQPGTTDHTTASSSSSGGDDTRHDHHTDTDTHSEEAAEAVVMPTFAEIHDAFRVLQLVRPDGRVVRVWTAADVKQSYRTLAKQLHPDVAGGDDALMERVNASYELLSELPAELADNYRMWLETGGEVALLRERAEEQQELLRARWATSSDVEQLMMVGWCTTMSGIAIFVAWRALYGASPVASSVGGPSGGSGAGASTGASTAAGTTASLGGGAFGMMADAYPVGGRLTLPRAGFTVSTAAGVQYGVVSSGDSALWMPPQLSRRVMAAMRSAVSHYALAVALTLAACVNTMMLQRVLLRLVHGR